MHQHESIDVIKYALSYYNTFSLVVHIYIYIYIYICFISICIYISYKSKLTSFLSQHTSYLGHLMGCHDQIHPIQQWATFGYYIFKVPKNYISISSSKKH